MRLHENPYFPNVIIVALLFLVFFALKLEQPTGYVTGVPSSLSATPTPFPDGCGTFEQMPGKVGIKTKKNIDAGALSGTGCVVLADSQYKCPVQDYYEKKLCCVSEDCGTDEICESSGIYSGFCKPVCSQPAAITCKSSAIDSVTIEFPAVSKAAKYRLEWCVAGHEWETDGKCRSVADSTNTITVSGLDSNVAYAFRARADEPMPDASGGMSCSAPGKWSSPLKCITIPLTPLPTATPTPAPLNIGIALTNPGFETEPDGTDWNSPDSDNRIWDSAQKHSGSRSYKIRLPTSSKCYKVGSGKYKISAFAYSENTEQLIYYVEYTDDACETMAGIAVQAAESSAVGAWKELSGMLQLEYDSIQIIMHTGESGKYAWFDDVSLTKTG